MDDLDERSVLLGLLGVAHQSIGQADHEGARQAVLASRPSDAQQQALGEAPKLRQQSLVGARGIVPQDAKGGVPQPEVEGRIQRDVEDPEPGKSVPVVVQELLVAQVLPPAGRADLLEELDTGLVVGAQVGDLFGPEDPQLEDLGEVGVRQQGYLAEILSPPSMRDTARRSTTSTSSNRWSTSRQPRRDAL